MLRVSLRCACACKPPIDVPGLAHTGRCASACTSLSGVQALAHLMRCASACTSVDMCKRLHISWTCGHACKQHTANPCMINGNSMGNLTQGTTRFIKPVHCVPEDFLTFRGMWRWATASKPCCSRTLRSKACTYTSGANKRMTKSAMQDPSGLRYPADHKDRNTDLKTDRK